MKSNNVLPQDREIWSFLGTQFASVLRYHYIQEAVSFYALTRAETPGAMGLCHYEDNGSFRIGVALREFRNGRWSKRYPAWEVIDTLAHELAHVYSDQHDDRWGCQHAKFFRFLCDIDSIRQLEKLYAKSSSPRNRR